MVSCSVDGMMFFNQFMALNIAPQGVVVPCVGAGNGHSKASGIGLDNGKWGFSYEIIPFEVDDEAAMLPGAMWRASQVEHSIEMSCVAQTPSIWWQLLQFPL